MPEEKAITEEGKAALKESEKREEAVGKDEKPITIDESETTETPRVALQVPESVHVSITRENLKDYVGPPVFTSDRLYDITPPGVVMGLAWTQMGGAALYVESILEQALTPNSRPGMERTGNLKNVMKESTSIAYSFAKSLMAKGFPSNRFFEKAKIHLHCPEGAVQKDGKQQSTHVQFTLTFLIVPASFLHRLPLFLHVMLPHITCIFACWSITRELISHWCG